MYAVAYKMLKQEYSDGVWRGKRLIVFQDTAFLQKKINLLVIGCNSNFGSLLFSGD
jgi:hypothetical protein